MLYSIMVYFKNIFINLNNSSMWFFSDEGDDCRLSMILFLSEELFTSFESVDPGYYYCKVLGEILPPLDKLSSFKPISELQFIYPDPSLGISQWVEYSRMIRLQPYSILNMRNTILDWRNTENLLHVNLNGNKILQPVHFFNARFSYNKFRL